MAVHHSLGGEPAPPHSPDGPAVHATVPGRHPLLTPDEERRLAWAARAGDRRAAVRLIEANLRVVIEIARSHATCGVPFLDLVQEGNVGLLHALDGFDPASGGRFSTFAFWSIQHAVRQAAADQRRLVRIPPATAEAMDRLRLAAGRLAQVLGREPAAGELAQELGTTAERAGRLMRLSGPALPADGMDGVDGMDGAPQGVSPPDEAVLVALRVDLYAVLARLTARERRVLRLRLGLVDGRRCSPQEIAHRLGLTCDRVRQIETEALARLRHAAGAPGPDGPQGEPLPSL